MYELAGAVAEAMELTGEENLGELVKTFTRHKANYSAAEKKKLSTLQGKIREKMSLILGDFAMRSEYKNRQTCLKSLAQEHILLQFAAKYDVISPDLFRLERIVEMKHPTNSNARDPIRVRMPLFMQMELEEPGPAKFEAKYREGSSSYNSIEIKLEMPVPPITRDAKEKAKQAAADFFEAYTGALRKPIIGDWLLQDGLSVSDKFAMNIYWIPRSEDIKSIVRVIERDPIIIAEAFNHNFLVAKWNVEGEMPFEHYLAEYKV
ncbi:hypothetical protein KY335_01365 [Candidatus Woesearchaeota archaeon]|nr:hypothetical protein [Candidatus Woesearchaeota archaeon]